MCCLKLGFMQQNTLICFCSKKETFYRWNFDNFRATLYTGSILCATSKILPAFECRKQRSRWKFSISFSMGQPCTRSLRWYVYIHFCLHCFQCNREISWFICAVLVEQNLGQLSCVFLNLAKPRNGTLIDTRQNEEGYIPKNLIIISRKGWSSIIILIIIHK